MVSNSRPKRGRPPKVSSELSTVRRRIGRPRGSGPKQQAKAKAELLGNFSPREKRPVGRPRKADSGLRGGKVTVKVLTGRIVRIFLFQIIFLVTNFWQSIPGSSGPPRPSSAPQLNATSSFSVFQNSASTHHGQHHASSLPPEVARQPFHSADYLNRAGKSSLHTIINQRSTPLPSPSLSHQIIPAEDPQRAVDLGDDDGDPEVSGEGLGEENEPELVDDEIDDEDDVGREETGSEDTAMPHARRALPPWLYDDFKAKVTESGHRNDKGLPPLYADHETFWFPRPSTFFVLRRNNVSPQLLYNPRFFLWDPEALCRIPCPNCKTALQRHGPISHPRRCVDSDSSFWIIGYRYRCRVCCHRKSQKHMVTFRSWDSRILAMLPSELAAEFPARLSHRSGISKTLFGWMRSSFQNGMGSKQFSDALVSSIS